MKKPPFGLTSFGLAPTPALKLWFDQVETASETPNDARYNSASANLIDRIDRYNTRFYGVRCAEFEAGCPICDIWKIRDEMKAFICD